MRKNATASLGVAQAAQLMDSLDLLRRHRPYTEGDHVLSLVTASFCGARTLDDIDTFREDGAILGVVAV